MADSRITKEATDRFATVEGVSLHYNDSQASPRAREKAGAPPALVGFHGGGPGANAWDNTRFNIDDLLKHFRVLLVDLPGYGESDKDVTLPPGTFVDHYFARLIRRLLDQLGIERAHLYASSFSGLHALKFGLEYPERTGKIGCRRRSPGRTNRCCSGRRRPRACGRWARTGRTRRAPTWSASWSCSFRTRRCGPRNWWSAGGGRRGRRGIWRRRRGSRDRAS
ncbi:MAG: alpha/beta fold hydrolase [SAR202 cluster bacterium]|nr:alpha/beta fold hydrolase [SAR202 cluster bacterium]